MFRVCQDTNAPVLSYTISYGSATMKHKLLYTAWILQYFLNIIFNGLLSCRLINTIMYGDI